MLRKLISGFVVFMLLFTISPSVKVYAKPDNFDNWAKAAINWGKASIGEKYYDSEYTYCLRHTCACYRLRDSHKMVDNKGSGYNYAKDLEDELNKQNKVYNKEYDGWKSAPPGSMLFFRKMHDFGHIVLYLGNGKIIDGGLREPVKEVDINSGSYRKNYSGWAYPIENWRPSSDRIDKWANAGTNPSQTINVCSIERARYGIENSWHDVAQKLRDKLHHGSFDLTDYDGLFGNPFQGRQKVLQIRFNNGSSFEDREFKENTPLRFNKVSCGGGGGGGNCNLPYPRQESPRDGDTVSKSGLTLLWQRVDGAKNYKLKVFNSNKHLIAEKQAEGTNHGVADLVQEDQTYYWSVASNCQDSNSGPESPLWRFYVKKDDTCKTPSVIKPKANIEIVLPFDFLIENDRSVNVTEYELEILNEHRSQVVYRDRRGHWMFILQPGSLEQGKRYYARARVKCENGVWSAFSSEVPFSVKDDSPPLPRGNSTGNIVNHGYVALQGDWLYFKNHTDGNKLYKMLSAGTNVSKLSDDVPSYINVVGDWIYYRNDSDEGKIYKIHTDSSNRTKLCEDESRFLNVVGEWVYYQNNSNKDMLYKIRTDGTSKTKLTDESIWWPNVIDNWIYYYNHNMGGRLFKIKTSGVQQVQVNQTTSWCPNVSDGWIYYIDRDNGNRIYKIHIDGHSQTKLNEESSNSINVSSNWIYYTNQNNGNFLYKINIDGKGRTQLNQDKTHCISVINDWIYYTNESDGYKLYKIRKDGTGRQLVTATTGIQKIVVTTPNRSISTNSTLRLSAQALDSTGKEVPNVSFYWSINPSHMGSIDQNGIFTSNSNTGFVEIIAEAQGIKGNFIIDVFKTATTLRDVNVSVSPNTVGSIARYNIRFKVGSNGSLNANQDTISIDFPPDTIIPATISANSITVNGNFLPVRPQVDIGRKKITFSLPCRIENDANVEINISQSSIIKNPPNDGSYRIALYTSKESQPVLSSYYTIVRNDSPPPPPEEPSDKSRGNSVGNIVNEGLVAKQDDWIYYSNFSDLNSLYKIRIDGTGRIKLNNDKSGYLNVIDGWIYYRNSSDGHCLYKIRTDGTGRMKLNNDISNDINVVNNWIFYSAECVYKIQIDGTGRTKLSEDVGRWGSFLNVVDQWIYYCGNEGSLYKRRIDGSGSIKLIDNRVEYLNVLDEWIFFSNWGDGQKLYKIRTDGTGKTKLNDDTSWFINVIGEWVYYSSQEDRGKLYKIRTDGTGKTKLNDDTSWFINVIGEWVYYLSQKDNKFCKIRIDGTGRQVVLSSPSLPSLPKFSYKHPESIFYKNNLVGLSRKLPFKHHFYTMFNVGWKTYIKHFYSKNFPSSNCSKFQNTKLLFYFKPLLYLW